ncbi:MAG: hypothetical protein ACI4JC_08945 [Faecalibacterium sp.]
MLGSRGRLDLGLCSALFMAMHRGNAEVLRVSGVQAQGRQVNGCGQTSQQSDPADEAIDKRADVVYLILRSCTGVKRFPAVPDNMDDFKKG